ncbi:MAG: phospho-sugar mutase [Oscillospiraceae bacterium]|nr:phospho-sugar mutase [Oscillospiraceae bacterium]
MDGKTMQKYNLWLQNALEDIDLTNELNNISNSEDEISDRFYRELEFGTGGLRGVIGAGDNRMNIYTVRKATQGLADYLKLRYASSSVAISFDSRIKSDLFAREAARVLAGNGITVHIFTQLQPTPVLSFAVRELGCQAGIMVTASHNPSKYNGYKCYGADGCQMTDNDAGEVTGFIKNVDVFEGVTISDFDQALNSGLISEIPSSLVENFFEKVEEQQVNKGICQRVPLGVVYTPLNGAGNIPVREILRRIGVQHVSVVPEQEMPDGRFPTVPYPNPEIRQAFECAISLAKSVKPDILLATDPDCDRVGIAVAHEGDYRLMSGNEVGCLVLNYLLSCKSANGTLPKKPVFIKTIVTSDLAARIAEKYNCEVIEVLTGFKYIGEQITRLENEGRADSYVFGFEESYGYLSGTHVRDKDGVLASMLVCEMTAYYKEQGKNLIQVLDELYASHGVYHNILINAEFEGSQGMETMERIMKGLREDRPDEIAGLRVVGFSDYLSSRSIDMKTGKTAEIDLPKSNVLSFSLEGNAGVIVRPSGTEPKIKAYITAAGADADKAASMAGQLTAAAEKLLKGI